MLNSVDLLVEGGAVFKTKISFVPKEHLQSTLDRALKDSGLDKMKAHLVGNVSAAYLGDVDVAIDWNQLVKKFKSTGEKRDFWQKAEVFMKKQRVKDFAINKGLQQIHILSPLVDDKGKSVPAVDATGKEIGKQGWVQIDLMIGAADFMKQSLAGATSGKYKGKIRNNFFGSIFANSIRGKEGDEIQHKFQVNWKVGVQYVRFISKGEKKNKLNIKTVFTNMDDVVAYVFGEKYTFKDVDTFEKMWKVFHAPTFRWKNKRKEIVSDFKRTLDKSGIPIPDEVLKEIKMNKEELNSVIEETILEMLQEGDRDLIKLMVEREKRYGDVDEKTFLTETISTLKENLGILDFEEDAGTALEKEEDNLLVEVDEMRRLSGLIKEGADESAATELVLYIENDAQLYKQQFQPIIKNLQKKFKSGKYDKDKAIKLWTYMAETGAKKYAREFADAKDWNTIFTVATRKEVARQLEENNREEVESG